MIRPEYQYFYDLGLSTRLANALASCGIRRIRDLAACRRHQIRNLPNLGKVTFGELEKLMASEGVEFLPYFYERELLPFAPRYAISNGCELVFYVRVSAMDETPEFIRETALPKYRREIYE